MIEIPQGFVVAEECRKAAWQNGYRRPMKEKTGWARYGSTTAKGTIYLSATGPSGPWFLALDHTGIVEELEHPRADIPGPGLACYTFATLTELLCSVAQGLRPWRSVARSPAQRLPRRNLQPAEDHRGPSASSFSALAKTSFATVC